MRKPSLFKKISLYYTYKKLLKNAKKELELKFNARVDRVSRIYTVLNVPMDTIEEPYNLRKSDIDTIAQTFIKEYTNQLSKFLNENGLYELYDFYETKKVGKYSYLLIFGYSLFNTQKIAKRLFIYIPLIILSISTILFIYSKLSS